ncbi:MAG: cytidylyltransferase domain-containing protein [Gammaproteobacteria bacterium]
MTYTSGFSIYIPARLASTRFPNKPLALINGEPMLSHVVRTALSARARRVVVVTDHLDIDVLMRSAFPGIYTHIDIGLFRSGGDACAHAARELKEPEEGFIVVLQGDMPLADIEDVQNVVTPWFKDKTHRVMSLVSDIPANVRDAVLANPNRVKCELDEEGKAKRFFRTRDIGPTATSLLHHGIYGYPTALLMQMLHYPSTAEEKTTTLEQYRVLGAGYQIHCAMSEYSRGLSVDVPEDLETIGA